MPNNLFSQPNNNHSAVCCKRPEINFNIIRTKTKITKKEIKGSQ